MSKLLEVRLPGWAQWVWLVHEVSPIASTGYDYKRDHFYGGEPQLLEPGAFLMIRHRKTDVVSCHVVLADGKLEATGRDCGMGNWAQLLSGYVRSWTSLSPKSRILRLANEKLEAARAKRTRQADHLDTDETIKNLTEENRWSRVLSEEMGEIRSLSDDEDVWNAFNGFLDTTAAATRRSRAEVLATLNDLLEEQKSGKSRRKRKLNQMELAVINQIGQQQPRMIQFEEEME